MDEVGALVMAEYISYGRTYSLNDGGRRSNDGNKYPLASSIMSTGPPTCTRRHLVYRQLPLSGCFRPAVAAQIGSVA